MNIPDADPLEAVPVASSLAHGVDHRDIVSEDRDLTLFIRGSCEITRLLETIRTHFY